MGDINAELQRSNSTSSLPTDGGTTSAMTSDYDSEDYGDGPSDSPVPSDQPQSSSQDEEERPDSAEIDKDWGVYKCTIDIFFIQTVDIIKTIGT